MIRPAQRQDLDRLVEIEQASFPDPWSPAMLEAELDTAFARVYAAEAGGRVQGYCILRRVFGEGEIFNIAVAPEERGKGLGEALLRHALAEAAADCDFVFLEVRESNAPARGLYEKLGFEAVGKRPGYYLKPKEDAILMRFAYPVKGEGENC